MPKNIELRIDSPCSESWANMLPEEKGRFCLSCNNSVIDFTGMSDREVLNWFAKPQEGLCGRFENTQLNRKLVTLPQRIQKRFAGWNYLFAGLLLSSGVSAQSAPKPGLEKAFVLPENPPKSPPAGVPSTSASRISMLAGKPVLSIPDSTGWFRGHLVDSATNQPVVGATIMIDAHNGCISDVNGYFALSRKRIPSDHTIKISMIGYHTFTIDVNKTWGDGQDNAVVQLIPIDLNSNVIVAGYAAVIVHRRKTPKRAFSILKDTLACIGLAENALTVYPNPAPRGSSVTLALRLDDPGTYAAELFSLTGALMKTIKVEGTEKSTTLPMEIPADLTPGIYFVRLSNPSVKKVYTRKLEVL